MTRRRAILELTLAYALILLVIWTPNPIQRVLYITAVIVLATILARSFESCDKLGLRLTNLTRSLWIALVGLALTAVLIVAAAHLHTLKAPPTLGRFVARYWGYALWAFVQQILLQDVFLGRLLILTPSPRLAALTAATIFGLAHLPNPILTPITFIWGLLSCVLFLRYRNIIPLAITHVVLGITLAITIPSPLIRNMRVGLGYLHYGAHHPTLHSQIKASLLETKPARLTKPCFTEGVVPPGHCTGPYRIPAKLFRMKTLHSSSLYFKTLQELHLLKSGSKFNAAKTLHQKDGGGATPRDPLR